MAYSNSVIWQRCLNNKSYLVSTERPPNIEIKDVWLTWYKYQKLQKALFWSFHFFILLVCKLRHSRHVGRNTWEWPHTTHSGALKSVWNELRRSYSIPEKLSCQLIYFSKKLNTKVFSSQNFQFLHQRRGQRQVARKVTTIVLYLLRWLHLARSAWSFQNSSFGMAKRLIQFLYDWKPWWSPRTSCSQQPKSNDVDPPQCHTRQTRS